MRESFALPFPTRGRGRGERRGGDEGGRNMLCRTSQKKKKNKFPQAGSPLSDRLNIIKKQTWRPRISRVMTRRHPRAGQRCDVALVDSEADDTACGGSRGDEGTWEARVDQHGFMYVPRSSATWTVSLGVNRRPDT